MLILGPKDKKKTTSLLFLYNLGLDQIKEQT
jgi:hypothetical protein